MQDRDKISILKALFVVVMFGIVGGLFLKATGYLASGQNFIFGGGIALYVFIFAILWAIGIGPLYSALTSFFINGAIMWFFAWEFGLVMLVFGVSLTAIAIYAKAKGNSGYDYSSF